MMFAQCNEPIWRVDDFTTCFRREYLQTLLPLIACAFSLLLIAFASFRQLARGSKERDHAGLNKTAPNGAPDYPTDDDVETAVSDDEEAPLIKTISNTNHSIAEVREPSGGSFVTITEIIALAAEVGLHIAVISTHAWGHSPRAQLASYVSLVVWAYLALLVGLRLLYSRLEWKTPVKLWNHTTSLYCTQWLFAVILFRGEVLHPKNAAAEKLMIADFVLNSLLALMTITTRRGNKAVVLVYEDNLEPSHEPEASILSLLTFGWVDAIVWKGYKKTFQIEDVWNLLPKDKAVRILADYRQVAKTTRLSYHLLKHFKRQLFQQQIWAFIAGLFLFVPTLLLRAIIQYIEDPSETPKSVAWLYVILLFISGTVGAVADGQGLWIGRKICIRLRAIMVGEVYAKTLRRKAASSKDTDMNADDKPKMVNGKKKSMMQIIKSFFEKDNKADGELPIENGEVAKAEPAEDTQVNSGTIINLMSVDAFKVAEISAYLHFLFPAVPTELAIAILLLWNILGWSAIAGIAVMIAVLPLNVWISGRFSYAHKRIMSATDGRIHITNEVLQNVRIVKYFAWEDRFARDINNKRSIEIKALRYRLGLWAGASVVWYGVPLLITGFSFFLYTYVEERPLLPSVAFTALSLFSLLRIPLDRLADMMARVQEGKVSIDRVDKFLNEDETGKYEQLADEIPGHREDYIGFKNATFSWGTLDEPAGAASAFRLINIDVEFKPGRLNIIAGPTGSGKTSMLMALLGEMTLINGTVHLPGGYSRQDLKPDPETGLTDSVAYCAQQAWLVNDTIKANILFASPFSQKRYDAVIEACALKSDLKVLDGGDMTLVGEKGIVVSGGQKQRISLARALYSNAKHILLDDCLSAVDSHTAQHIFDKCINGPMMLGRTCILVTHNISLTVPQASHVVVLANGKIATQGQPEKVMQSGLLGEEMKASRPVSKDGTRMHSRKPSGGLDAVIKDAEDTNGQANGEVEVNGAAPANMMDQINEDSATDNANARTEAKAEGAVDWRVIKLYIDSMGPWYFWIGILVLFGLENIAQVSTNVWIRTWANSYATEDVGALIASSKNHSTTNIIPFGVGSSFGSGRLSTWNVPYIVQAANYVMPASAAKDDIGYYLAIYGLLSVLYVFVFLAKLTTLFKGSLNASRALHGSLLDHVLRAKFKFFDTTPLGQIMNRFSKDLQSIDQDVALVAAGVLQGIYNISAIVILISVITPGFLLAGLFLTALYTAIGMFYIRSSRDLKRLESVQRSPLYQQFGETLSGIVTIRAYGDERRFIADNAQRINTHNRPFIYLWGANRWLAFRVDVAGALVAFFAGAFVVASVGKIDAGAAGLSLTYALTFNENVLWLVRLYADNEQNMNHVERVKVFLEVEQEAPAKIPSEKPAGNWPSCGQVEFIDYTTRYRTDLDPVLKNITFKINGEEKVGIVGRTGAGKSSLALALFRGLEAETGKILIDDVDIGLIGLQDLRENITIVPQDPTLFTGTIRSNLDPFGLFTDEEIFTALRRVHLIGPNAISSTTPSAAEPSTPTESQSEPHTQDTLIPSTEDSNDLTRVLTNSARENKNLFLNLLSPIAESGSNLSQGQRQLLCLARALLKSPRVLLMDEATASIDYATDAKIQDTLRELEGSTIITIAHRLQTIIDYDKVLVLDKGSVVEYDSPWELLKKEEGIFRSMCEMSGDMETLQTMADKAERKNKLVDV